MANILFICSATPKLYFGLVQDDVLVYWEVIDGQKHASEINRAYATLLSQYPELHIDAVACNLGPGSYTGLRVGLSFAKALCVSTDAVLLGLDTLEALAHSVSPESDDKIYTAIDARRLEVFASFWGADFSAETSLLNLVLDSPEAQNALSPYQEHVVICVGSGASKSLPFIKKSKLWELSDEQYIQSLTKLAIREHQNQNHLDLVSARPNYGKQAHVTQPKKLF